MPIELLDPGARIARREWFEARQLYVWRDQHDALQRSREAHGLLPDGRRPGEPDPRDILRDLRQRRGADQEAASYDHHLTRSTTTAAFIPVRDRGASPATHLGDTHD